MKHLALMLVVVALVVVAVLGFILVMDTKERDQPPPPRGALESHAWTRAEMVEAQVTEFTNTLEYPAEALYVTEYMVSVVRVVEATPNGDIHWSVTLMLTEDGWTFITALRVPPPSELP